MNKNSIPNKEMYSLLNKIESNPYNSENYYALGLKYKSLKEYTKALINFDQAIKLNSQIELYYLNKGACELELNDYAEATRSFVNALKIDPTRAETYNILGSIFIEVGLTTESVIQFLKAIELQPSHAAAYDNLGRAYLLLGKPTRAIEAHTKAFSLSGHTNTYSNLLYALNLVPGIDEKKVYSSHTQFNVPHAYTPLKKELIQKKSKIKIGFVSGDFLNHAVSYFLLPLINHINKANFEIICFSNNNSKDSTTALIENAVHEFLTVTSLDDSSAHRFIASKDIDILIDLSGHTARNRLGVFALKAAPIQVTWLGYPNTTGLKTIDYRITDALTDPLGQSDSYHTEKLLRIPKCFICYEPFKDAPDPVETPALKNNYVTFGSFNNISKVNTEVIKAWSALLLALPNSQLFIRSKGLQHKNNTAYLLSLFSENNINPNRISFSGEILSKVDHNTKYNLVDIALDTFPYNGTTTTCEALWMGVPVITLAGNTHRSRVGKSILTQLNRPSWIAESVEDYVNKALTLASNPKELNLIRKHLRSGMLTSTLCDANDFALRFEDAISSMISHHVN